MTNLETVRRPTLSHRIINVELVAGVVCRRPVYNNIDVPVRCGRSRRRCTINVSRHVHQGRGCLRRAVSKLLEKNIGIGIEAELVIVKGLIGSGFVGGSDSRKDGLEIGGCPREGGIIQIKRIRMAKEPKKRTGFAVAYRALRKDRGGLGWVGGSSVKTRSR